MSILAYVNIFWPFFSTRNGFMSYAKDLFCLLTCVRVPFCSFRCVALHVVQDPNFYFHRTTSELRVLKCFAGFSLTIR